jgi:hypothetical protein
VGFVGITEDILFPSVGLHSYGEKVRVRFQPPFVFQAEAINKGTARHTHTHAEREREREICTFADDTST